MFLCANIDFSCIITLKEYFSSFLKNALKNIGFVFWGHCPSECKVNFLTDWYTAVGCNRRRETSNRWISVATCSLQLCCCCHWISWASVMVQPIKLLTITCQISYSGTTYWTTWAVCSERTEVDWAWYTGIQFKH